MVGDIKKDMAKGGAFHLNLNLEYSLAHTLFEVLK